LAAGREHRPRRRLASFEQLEANLGAADLRLTADEMRRLDEASPHAAYYRGWFNERLRDPRIERRWHEVRRDAPAHWRERSDQASVLRVHDAAQVVDGRRSRIRSSRGRVRRPKRFDFLAVVGREGRRRCRAISRPVEPRAMLFEVIDKAGRVAPSDCSSNWPTPLDEAT